MKRIKLDSVLLFVLLVPFIMNYRISPDLTPFWLFGLIFAGLLSYALIDILDLKEKIKFSLKYILLSLLILGSIGAASYSAIIVRHQTSPIYNIHDVVLQQEAAIRFLLHGKNPYEENYFNTPMADWNYSDKEVNPALYHFVMQPFYLISAIPFYLVSTRTLGFFDGRMPLIFAFVALLLMAFKLIEEKQKKLEFVILLAFNPATLGYFLEGRADIYMFVFLFASFMLFHKNRHGWGSFFMGLAFAIKQSVWPIVPFYFAYLYFKNKNFKETIIQIVPFMAVFFVIVAPFIVWNFKAFMDSTIFFLSGNVVHSYPISGYGFGMFLNQVGVIKDVHSYFPFTIIQIIIGLPLMVILIFWQKRKNNVYSFIVSYSIFLFVYWYFSRYFNNSHVGYISMLFLAAYFWPEESSNK